ncbi:hypothetical protein PF010_g31499, partial [Phytophthora fragariae]
MKVKLGRLRLRLGIPIFLILNISSAFACDRSGSANVSSSATALMTSIAMMLRCSASSSATVPMASIAIILCCSTSR